MAGSFDASSTEKDAPGRKSGQSDEGAARRQAKWTLAVDLAADLLNEKGQAIGAGTLHKWQQLKALTGKTEGAPVNLVVSLPHLDVAATSVDDLRRTLPDYTKPSAQPLLTIGPRQAGPQVDTYLIANGKMSLLETHNSAGLAGDLQNLLETARRAAPSERLGLHLFAHGSGLEEGMRGDTGIADQQELHDAIRGGLGDRDKLDVIDFDGCKMASTDTARNMQDVARIMVASADDEAADLKLTFDGQNIPAALNALIARPDQTAADFAQSLVAQAESGLNGTAKKVESVSNHLRAGTDTLTAFDLSRYAEFEKNLNQFARTLSVHLENSGDRSAIGEAIDKTASYPSHLSASTNCLRDTKQFAQNLIDQIQRGKLIDDGSLRRAAEALLASQSAMTLKQHNNDDIYRGVGGLTTFLPVTSVESRHEMARRQSAVQAAMVDVPAYLKLFQFKPLVDSNNALIIGTTGFGMSPEDRAKLKPLNDARLKVAASRNQAEYTRALASMQTEAKKFVHSDLGRKQVDAVARTAHPPNGDPRRSEWSRVVDDLITRSEADSAAAQR